MYPNLQRIRNISRYRKIASVFARHGFGVVIEKLGLDRYLSMPYYVRRKPPPAPKPPEVRLRLTLEELGPTFIKLGQIAGARPDLLPAEYILELSRLQDSVPPEPWEKIQAALLKEYGSQLESIFAEINHQPLGSASLAQVHSGRLVSGEEVVLKIQRPGIIPTIESDLEILSDIAQLAQRSDWGELFHPVEIINHFSFVLHNELDFRLEGSNADRFRTNFAGEPHLYVPKIYWDISTRVVLVEERLRGIKIDQVEALEDQGYDRHEVAEIATKLLVQQVLEDGFFHADPHPGNFYISRDDVSEEILIGAMDFGMVGHISQVDRLNLIQAFMLVARQDSPGLVEHLLRIGAITDQNDLPALEHDLDLLIDRYQGLSLKYIYTPQIMEELMQLAFHHRISLPTDFWLLFKALIILDGLARRLDPEMSIFGIFTPYVKSVVRRMYLPSNWGPSLMNNLEALAFILRDAPTFGERILHGLQRGEIPISFKAGANKETLDRLDRVTTRVSISLLVAAFIVGTALIFPMAADNRLAMIILISGFIFSLGLGGWFIISILRGGRK